MFIGTETDEELAGETFSGQIKKACNISPSALDDFLRNFFCNIPDAVFLANKNGDIVWYNYAAARIITPKSSRGKAKRSDVCPKYSIDIGIIRIIKDFVQVAFENQQEVHSVEESCIINDNMCTFLWDTCFITEQNQISGIILIAKDITDIKKSHEETTRYAMQKIVDQVASGLAHEIRNPLTAVRGFIQLLHEGLRRSPKREYLQVALDELDRANRFIKDFLLFVRPAAPNFSLVSLALVIEEAMSYIRHQASLDHVHFQLVSKGNFPLMYLDQEQIIQALKNVLQNAVDFCPNGNIEIQVINMEISEKVFIIVRDSGCGIPENAIPKIFEPFFTTKEEAPGMGLTLAQCIINNHGGDISVGNNEDKGVVVKIELYHVSRYPNGT